MSNRIILVGLFIVLAVGGVFAAKSSEKMTEDVVLSTGFTLPEAKQPVKLEKLVIKRFNPDPEQVLTLDRPVFKQTVDYLLAGLEAIRQDGYDTAYLLLDSPGGSVIDGGRLIDYMKTTKLKIVTVCTGICASMAAQIHQQGTVRLMQPKATLMFHQASGGVMGTLEQMESQIGWIKKYVDRLDAEVVARTKMTYADFKARIQNELWLEGVDALNLGFADGLAYVNSGATDSANGAPFIPTVMPNDKSGKAPDARKHEFTY